MDLEGLETLWEIVLNATGEERGVFLRRVQVQVTGWFVCYFLHAKGRGSCQWGDIGGGGGCWAGRAVERGWDVGEGGEEGR